MLPGQDLPRLCSPAAVQRGLVQRPSVWPGEQQLTASFVLAPQRLGSRFWRQPHEPRFQAALAAAHSCCRQLCACAAAGLPPYWIAGQGSGVFYAGYVLFQVPSNLILSRLGACTWLPFITAAWGTVATCCVFIKGKHTQHNTDHSALHPHPYTPLQRGCSSRWCLRTCRSVCGSAPPSKAAIVHTCCRLLRVQALPASTRCALHLGLRRVVPFPPCGTSVGRWA